MAEEHKTFQLRYVGARFAGARLPLDVLSDLPAFRDLLVSYAKERWRTKHADRERLPKGFDKSISFDLIAIEEGSAMPKLDWDRKVAQDVLPGFTDELDDLVDTSFREVLNLIDEAGNNRFPTALSSEHIRALNKLGSGLLDGERIEFMGSRGGDGDVVYLDNYRRKTLITKVRETYQARYEGIGTLVGLHVDGFIDVKTEDHGDLRLRVDPTRIDKEFDGNTNTDVQFSVMLELDSADRNRSIIEVFNVELIDEELADAIVRCRSRLEELAGLSQGWLNGSGEPLAREALAGAKALIDRRPYLTTAFRLYPVECGGVLIEFAINGWDYSVELDTQGKVEVFGVEVDGDGERGPENFDGIEERFLVQLDGWTQGGLA